MVAPLLKPNNRWNYLPNSESFNTATEQGSSSGELMPKSSQNVDKHGQNSSTIIQEVKHSDYDMNYKKSSKDSVASENPSNSSLVAMMVTLGPHGFMLIRRCEEGSEDAPLLAVGGHVSPSSSSSTRHPQRGSGATGLHAVGESANKNDGSSNDNKNKNIIRDNKWDVPRSPPAGVVGLYFPPPSLDASVVSVSGAGDCLASGFIAGLLDGLSVSECAAVGNTAAGLSLQASPAVPTTLSNLRATQWRGRSLTYSIIQ